MNELEYIKAKGADQGDLSLLNHTQQVAEAIEIIAQGFNRKFDSSLVTKGAVLHDLGKAHPFFQDSISNYQPKSLIEKKRRRKFKHRHEISSLAFLPAFPKGEWPILIEMVVAHHKSIQEDPSARGIIDFEEDSNDNFGWIEDHLKDWEEWFPYGRQILQLSGYDCPQIPKKEAEKALRYTYDFCRKMKNGWSGYRGLLKAADHYASAFTFDTKNRLDIAFQKPNLSFYTDENRKSGLYPLSLISTNSPKKHSLVVAPTGGGKTDFLLKRTKGRIFYTLPFQASINAMYDRFRDTIKPKNGIRLQHGTSKIKVGKNIDEQIEQSKVGASVKVLTPHQLAGIIFGIKNFESIILDIEGCDVVLDEIHTYSEISQTMVIEIVKVLVDFNCRIHIGTATMPSPLYKTLLSLLGGPEKVDEVSLNNDELKNFNRHQIYKHETDFNYHPLLSEAISNNEKVLVILNTVKQAQSTFSAMKNEYPEIDILLIHSRFKRKDRIALERRLTEDYNKSKKACIVVSTQVVEVSLDISFDLMITQAAPLDSLVQRFGRVHRKRSQETLNTYRPIHILAPGKNTLPYNKEVVVKSFEQLPDDGVVFQETELQQKMDCVYQDLELRSIDFHLKYKEGHFTLKKLTDNSKSILIEALEVDGATCILESDREAYLEAHWKDRVQLEIPISYKSLWKFKDEYEQLDEGNSPFVVPQSEKAYQKIGLELVEHEKFL